MNIGISIHLFRNNQPTEFPVMANRFAQVNSENFSKIPGSPIAYWVSEKILKISEEYEKAKEEDNKELMEELKKEYEYQKAVLNASENFFAKYDEKEMKDKANYSSDEEEVKRAKWILKNKKEYQDKEDLFDAIIASKSLEEAKDVIEEAKEEKKEKNKKHGVFAFRKFKTFLILAKEVLVKF